MQWFRNHVFFMIVDDCGMIFEWLSDEFELYIYYTHHFVMSVCIKLKWCLHHIVWGFKRVASQSPVLSMLTHELSRHTQGASRLICHLQLKAWSLGRKVYGNTWDKFYDINSISNTNDHNSTPMPSYRIVAAASSSGSRRDPSRTKWWDVVVAARRSFLKKVARQWMYYKMGVPNPTSN